MTNLISVAFPTLKQKGFSSLNFRSYLVNDFIELFRFVMSKKMRLPK